MSGMELYMCFGIDLILRNLQIGIEKAMQIVRTCEVFTHCKRTQAITHVMKLHKFETTQYRHTWLGRLREGRGGSRIIVDRIRVKKC